MMRKLFVFIYPNSETEPESFQTKAFIESTTINLFNKILLG